MAEHRHKRETNARRKPPAVVVAGPLAVLATAAAVTLGVVTAGSGTHDLPRVSAGSSADLGLTRATTPPVTRSGDRTTTTTDTPRDAPSPAPPTTLISRHATARAVAKAHTQEWTTTDLNLWSMPGDKATQVGEVKAAKKVLVTGRTFWGRTEVVVDGKARWVTSGYLSDEKPVAAAAGLSMAPCPDGSVENRLTAGAVYVYRSVCHAFPQITSYGGWDAHGEHASGKAIDIMTSDVELGTAIADFLQAHASELHIYDILWRQHIWTPVRASEGWRLFASRGSATANHYDHVHVSVY